MASVQSQPTVPTSTGRRQKLRPSPGVRKAMAAQAALDLAAKTNTAPPSLLPTPPKQTSNTMASVQSQPTVHTSTSQRQKLRPPPGVRKAMAAQAALDLATKMNTAPPSLTNYKAESLLMVTINLSPKEGSLGAGEAMQFDVKFHPTRIGQFTDRLMMAFDSGECVYMSASGFADNAHIKLEKPGLIMDNTFIGLASKKTMRIFNPSEILADFKWNKFATAAEKDSYRLPFLSQQFRNEKRNIEQDPLLFDDSVFRIEPAQGTILPSSSIEVHVFFEPTAAAQRGRKRAKGVLLLRASGHRKIFIDILHTYEVVLENRGDIPLSYGLDPSTSLFGPKFRFSPDRCELAVGEQHNIQITFHPDVMGDISKKFIWRLEGGPEPLRICIKGCVVGPSFHFTVPDVNFEKVSYGFKSVRQIELVNTSQASMTYGLRIPSIDNGREPEFSVVPSKRAISPADSESLTVTFFPHSVKAYNACIIVDVDSVGSKLARLPIYAESVVPAIKLQNSLLAYGDSYLNYSYDSYVVLENDTDYPARYTLQAQEESARSVFQNTSTNREGILEPHSEVQINVQVQIKLLGEIQFPIFLVIRGNEDTPIVMDITANGIGPNIIADATHKDLGVVHHGESITKADVPQYDEHSIAHIHVDNGAYHHVESSKVAADVEPELNYVKEQTTNHHASRKVVEHINSKHVIPRIDTPDYVAPDIRLRDETSFHHNAHADHGVNHADRYKDVSTLEGESPEDADSDHKQEQSHFVDEPLFHTAYETSFHNAHADHGVVHQDFRTLAFHPTDDIAADEAQDESGLLDETSLHIAHADHGVVRHSVLDSGLGTLEAEERDRNGSVEEFPRATRSFDVALDVGLQGIVEATPRNDREPKVDHPHDTAINQTAHGLADLDLGIVSATELNWGKIPVLKHVPMILLLKNDSLISALSYCALEADFTITAHLDDSLKLTDIVKVATQAGSVHEVHLAARGQGTTITYDNELSRINFSHVFSSRPCSKSFTLFNRGRRPQTLIWSLDDKKTDKEIAAYEPVLVIPARFTLNPGTSQEMTVKGFSSKAMEVSKNLVCQGFMDKDPTRCQVHTAMVTAKSINPLMKMKSATLQFFAAHETDDEYVQLFEELQLKNTSTLPLQISFKSPSAYTVTPRVFEEPLEPGDTATVTVAYDPPYYRDRITKKEHATLVVSYAEHPQKDVVQIYSEVTFPNLSFKTSYGCSANNTNRKTVFGISNNSPLPVYNLWYFQDVEEDQDGSACGRDPALLQQVIDIRPMRGSLLPSEMIEATFAGHVCGKFNAVAICDVSGGPKYEVFMRGDVAIFEYQLDRQTVDFGIQPYQDVVEQAVTLINAGRVSFDFSALLLPLSSLQRKVTLSPASGTLSPKSRQKISIEPLRIRVTGRGTFPRIGLNIPRIADEKYEAHVAKLKATAGAGKKPKSTTPAVETRVVDAEVEECADSLLLREKTLELLARINEDTRTKLPPQPKGRFIGSPFLFHKSQQMKASDKKNTLTLSESSLVRLSNYICDFGNVIRNTFKKETVRLKNTGHYPLTLTLDKSMLIGTGFTIEPDKVRSLPAQEIAEFMVAFQARNNNGRPERFEVDLPVKVAGGPTIDIHLCASITVSDLTLPTAELDFGEGLCGARKTGSVKLQNPYPAPCEWLITTNAQGTSASTTAAVRPKQVRSKLEDFDVVPSSRVLEPGDSSILTVRFVPSEDKIYDDSIFLNINMNSKLSPLRVRGHGILPRIEFEPDKLTDHPVEMYSVEFDKQYLEEEALLRHLDGYVNGVAYMSPRKLGGGLPESVTELALQKIRAEKTGRDIATTKAAIQSGVGELLESATLGVGAPLTQTKVGRSYAVLPIPQPAPLPATIPVLYEAQSSTSAGEPIPNFILHGLPFSGRRSQVRRICKTYSLGYIHRDEAIDAHLRADTSGIKIIEVTHAPLALPVPNRSLQSAAGFAESAEMHGHGPRHSQIAGEQPDGDLGQGEYHDPSDTQITIPEDTITEIIKNHLRMNKFARGIVVDGLESRYGSTPLILRALLRALPEKCRHPLVFNLTADALHIRDREANPQRSGVEKDPDLSSLQEVSETDYAHMTEVERDKFDRMIAKHRRLVKEQLDRKKQERRLWEEELAFRVNERKAEEERARAKKKRAPVSTRAPEQIEKFPPSPLPRGELTRLRGSSVSFAPLAPERELKTGALSPKLVKRHALDRPKKGSERARSEAGERQEREPGDDLSPQCTLTEGGELFQNESTYRRVDSYSSTLEAIVAVLREGEKPVAHRAVAGAPHVDKKWQKNAKLIATAPLEQLPGGGPVAKGEPHLLDEGASRYLVEINAYLDEESIFKAMAEYIPSLKPADDGEEPKEGIPDMYTEQIISFPPERVEQPTQLKYCQYAAIASDPKRVFARIRRTKEEKANVHGEYIAATATYKFGPLLNSRSREKYQDRFPENRALINITNPGKQEIKVGVSLRNDVKSEVLFSEPSTIHLASGQSMILSVWPYPKTASDFEDAVLFCVKDNPEPVLSKISCLGVKPELEVDKKATSFDPALQLRGQAANFTLLASALALMKQKAKPIVICALFLVFCSSLAAAALLFLGKSEKREVKFKNSTLLPIAWKLAGAELHGEEFQVSPLEGILEPAQECVVSADVKGIKPVVIKKNLKLEVSDTEKVGGVVQDLPIVVTAEADDIAVDLHFPKGYEGLDFGVIKVYEEGKPQCTFRNKGKYEVGYRFVFDSKEHGDIFKVAPQQGIIQPSEKPFQVQQVFKSAKEPYIKDSMSCKRQFFEPTTSEVTAVLPVRRSAPAVFSKFSIMPVRDLNSGALVHGTKATRQFLIENLGYKFDSIQPLSLTLSGMGVPPPVQNEILKFMIPVRQSESKTIPVTNKSSTHWHVRPIIDNDLWTGHEMIDIEPGQSKASEITFTPLEMVGVGDASRHEGSVFFPLPDGSGMLCKLYGIADKPSPAGNITRDVPSKTQYTEVLPVANWLKRPQRVKMTGELAKPDPSVIIKGHEYMDLPALLSKDYKLSFYAFKEGVTSVKVTFRNEASQEFLFCNLTIRSTSAGVMAVHEFNTTVRQSITREIASNPLPTPVTFACTSPDITMPHSLTVQPKTDVALSIDFLPLQARETVSHLTLQSGELGVYQYDLKLIANAAGSERSLHYKVGLGGNRTQTFRFLSFAKAKTEYVCKLDSPDFSVEKTVMAPAATNSGVEVSLDVTCEPSRLGDARTQLVVSSATGGDFVCPLFGHSIAPRPQGPIAIKAGSRSILPFRIVFNSSAAFNFTADNPSFSVKRSETIGAKKTTEISITYKPFSPWSASKDAEKSDKDESSGSGTSRHKDKSDALTRDISAAAPTRPPSSSQEDSIFFPK
ncbi:hypothetical protein HKX48_003133 [Thoreauomyces humboldtii]|nr:hypothetical protein HKX48_003133 [Thoreauomyces humboldtii]